MYRAFQCSLWQGICDCSEVTHTRICLLFGLTAHGSVSGPILQTICKRPANDLQTCAARCKAQAVHLAAHPFTSNGNKVFGHLEVRPNYVYRLSLCCGSSTGWYCSKSLLDGCFSRSHASSWSCKVLTLEGEGFSESGRVHHQFIGSVVDAYFSCS